MQDHHIVSFLIQCALIAAAVVGNGLVVASVLSRKKTREKKNSRFIVSNAISDLFVGLFVMPFGMAQVVQGSWSFGKTWCQEWVMLDLTLCQASVFNMLSINIDRFYAVYLPIHHYTKGGKHVLPMIVLSWLLAPILIGPMFSPHMATQETWDVRTTNGTCLPPTGSDDLPWILYMTTFGFILPFSALFVLQVLILIKRQSSVDANHSRFQKKISAEKLARKLTKAGKTSAQMNVEIVRQRKITGMMAIVLIIFLVCWLPWWIMFIIFPFHTSAADWFEGSGEVWTPYNILTWLAYTNSCVEPFVYITMDKDIREGIVLMFMKVTQFFSNKNYTADSKPVVT